LETCLCDFYQTIISSNHARMSEAHNPSFPVRVFARPITSRVYYKTPIPSDNPACMSENLLFLLSLVRQHLRSIAAAHPIRRQIRLFTAVFYHRFCLFSYLITHHFFAFTFTFHFALSTAAQQFSLNCCCATPRRSNYACLLRQIGLFRPFAAVVKSANLVARLAVLRHKTTFSATKSAQLSRVVAVVGHSASAAAASITKKRTRLPIRFRLYTALSFVFTHHSLLLWLYSAL
jgi:hypothetical protein